jgi:hypothetical protein
MPALVHTASDIEQMLRRGLAPITDNASALMELGFERAYPQVRSGFDATIWERSIDLPAARDGMKRLVRERAFLAR